LSAHKRKDVANIDSLIETEWDILNDLKKILRDSETSRPEKIRAANALAYHASVLSRLLAKKGESSQFSEETLGDFIRDMSGKAARTARRYDLPERRRLLALELRRLRRFDFDEFVRGLDSWIVKRARRDFQEYMAGEKGDERSRD